jgi:large subunit ribosomal protein L15
MELSKLKPAAGSKKKKKRLGRGESSGLGKTSTRGGKGQTARSGSGIPARFEGGQMPLYRRIGKLGFFSRVSNLGKNQYNLVNLSTLDKFENGATVDEAALVAKGYNLSSKKKAGIKVLGTGDLTKKLNVKLSAFTASAKAKIESLGGTAEVTK